MMTMVTTKDNPFNFFTQFDDWFAFDTAKGYNTLSYLARVVVSSPDLSEKDQEIAFNQAVDEILRFNLTGNYIRVTDENLEKSQFRPKTA